MLIRFHGTRGSVPVSGQSFMRYGGNTSCVEVVCGERTVVLDAGTGIRTLREQPGGPDLPEIDLVFTHYHWDHIQGLPFFRPMYDPGATVRIFGLANDEASPRETLDHYLGRPAFPVALQDLPARVVCTDVRPGDAFDLGDVHIVTGPSQHPGGSLGIRVEYQGWVFTHLTDTEQPADGLSLHEPNVALARGADLVCLDASYTEDEYHGRRDGIVRRGWGHGTDAQAIRFAKEVRPGHLLLFHHGPEHDDDTLDLIGRRVRAEVPNSSLSFDGLTVRLGEPGTPPEFGAQSRG